MDLKAWSNSYEVIAARSAEEAHRVCVAFYDTNGYGMTAEEAEGDGWREMDATKQILDEDGTPIGQTIGECVAESPEPRHLWSVEQ